MSDIANRLARIERLLEAMLAEMRRQRQEDTAVGFHIGDIDDTHGYSTGEWEPPAPWQIPGFYGLMPGVAEKCGCGHYVNRADPSHRRHEIVSTQLEAP